MFLFAIFFLCGDLYLQTFSHLPNLLMITAAIFCGLIWFYFRKKIFLIFFAFAFGFCWSLWFAQQIISWKLPNEFEGQTITAVGYIASLPVINYHQASFLFETQRLNFKNKNINGKAKIRLVWRNPPENLQVGDQWQMALKLKRIHGLQNIGGFDYEAWALQNGIRAQGYVVNVLPAHLLSQHKYRYPFHFFRQKLLNKIKKILPDTAVSPWLLALIIGERSNIPQSQWEVLRATGTNHLMAIAGLHIGLVAGFFHLCFGWCWRRSVKLMLLWPAQQASALFALLTAFLYSAMAGFSLPTQRALIMLAMFIISILIKRENNVWQSWSWALFIVLLVNPLNVLTESFWLSFATIALIIFGVRGRLSPAGWWWKWGRTQWVIGVGLMPLTLMLFQQLSFISFIANIIAIPWLAFFILPFSLAANLILFFSSSAAILCLMIADKALELLWIILTFLSKIHFVIWHQPILNMAIFLFALIAVLLFLLPIGMPGRWLGIIWSLPLFFSPVNKPALQQFWVTLLDVGQGLAVVVQTKSHTLVYDTGAKFNENDSGERIVIPYLRTIGTKKLDMLVISHADNDHRGGAQSLLQAFPETPIKTSVVDKFPQAAVNYCLRGDAWRWDGVNFAFIYPTIDKLNLGNNSSCVLRIDNGVESILLTGDIEKFAEQALLQVQPQLKSTIMIAPHHGSKTSSWLPFVEAAHPEIVFYAIGYRNRFHFPHTQVVNRYTAIAAQQFNTAESGMINVKLNANNTTILSPQHFRKNHQRYWMD